MFTDRETILKAFSFRHACKQYDPSRRISDEDFRFILETARLSPSSFGLEPWRFLVVQNHERRKAIAGFALGNEEKIVQCSHFVVLLSRTQAAMQKDWQVHMWEKVHGMPQQIVETMQEHFENFCTKGFELQEARTFNDWTSKQSYIALSNMMIAAALIGIDSTPIEGFTKAAINGLLADYGLLGKGQFQISVMAAFGYRAVEPIFPKTRQAYSDIVQWLD